MAGTIINPNSVRRVQVEMLNGELVELNQQQLFEVMQGGGGIDIDRAADGVQALVGLLEKFEINDLVEDEKDARQDLKDANQKIYDYCKSTTQISGPQLADLFKKQMQAQEDLDQAQTEIGRALDRSVLVASGAAGAKALFSTRYGGGYAGLSGSSGTVMGLLGGVAAYKLLGDDDNDRGSRRRKRIGVSTSPA